MSDEDKLDLKWESMDDGAEIFGEPEKKKVNRTFTVQNQRTISSVSGSLPCSSQAAAGGDTLPPLHHAGLVRQRPAGEGVPRGKACNVSVFARFPLKKHLKLEILISRAVSV